MQVYPLPGDPVLRTQTDVPMACSPLAVESQVEHIRPRQNTAIYPLLADPASRTRSALVIDSQPPIPQWQSPTTDLPPADAILPDLPMASSSLAVESQTNIIHGDYIVHSLPAQPCRDHLHGEAPHQGFLHHDTSHSHTQEAHLFPCRWLHEDNISCDFSGSLYELKKHFNAIHLPGSQDGLTRCHWEGCDYCRRGNRAVNTMRLDSLWRHVLEMHLGIKYRKKV